MKFSKNINPAVPGFKASGLACGIKAGKLKDLTLIVSEVSANSAGVFTQNRVVSPSIVWSQKTLTKSRTSRAVVINSGNANAVVGPKGLKDCDTITQKFADELSIPQKEILIASTGVIGVPLPTHKILKAAPKLAQQVGQSPKDWDHAAKGILTTDLVSKTDRVQYTFQGKKIFIGGITKGSGMIHPNMATMLGVLCTSASIDSSTLKKALKEATDRSFNRITVDGDTSTNDCIFILANGTANNTPIKQGTASYKAFLKALCEICKNLAAKIVLDGEGATKFVTVRVEGAKIRQHAHWVANSIATSSLVKTALFGEDPNWGRILSAIGNAGVPIEPDRIDISLNKNILFKKGCSSGLSEKKLVKAMKSRQIHIDVNLHNGKESDEVMTCDMSYNYVKINAEYTT